MSRQSVWCRSRQAHTKTHMSRQSVWCRSRKAPTKTQMSRQSVWCRSRQAPTKTQMSRQSVWCRSRQAPTKTITCNWFSSFCCLLYFSLFFLSCIAVDIYLFVCFSLSFSFYSWRFYLRFMYLYQNRISGNSLKKRATVSIRSRLVSVPGFLYNQGTWSLNSKVK